MEKNIFGDWGADLSDEDYGRALAALGVIETTNKNQHWLSDNPSELAAKMRKEFKDGERTVVWLSSYRSVEIPKFCQQPISINAQALAEAWKIICGDFSFEPRRNASLAIGTDWRNFPNLIDFEALLNWLSIKEIGCQSMVLIPETQPVEYSPQVLWHWPLKVGIPISQAGESLCAAIRNVEQQSAGWVSKLARPRFVGKEQDKCDLLLLPPGVAEDLVDQPHLRIKTSFIISLDNPLLWQEAPETDHAALLNKMNAAGIALVGHPSILDFGNWYINLVMQLSHDLPIHAALWEIGRDFTIQIMPTIIGLPSGLDKLRILAVAEHIDRKFEILKPYFSREEPFESLSQVVRRGMVSESGDGLPMAHAIGERLAELRELGVEELMEARVDEDEGPRFLQTEVFDNSNPQELKKLSQAFLANQEHLLNVWIGELKEGTIVAPESIDFGLLPDLPSWNLQVYFWEPYHAAEVQIGQLTIFKEHSPGEPDSICSFKFQPQADRNDFQGRLAVLYENNVLQMLFLEGKVVSDLDQVSEQDEIQLKWAEIKGLNKLEKIQKFDMVFYNESECGEDSGLTFFGGITGLKRASGLDVGIKAMKTSLKQLGSPDLTTPEDHRSNLVMLANQGNGLYQTIREQIGGNGQASIDFREITRLQLVSAVRDVFPLEMVYVYPPPEPDAVLCPHWDQAILEGKCDHCESLDEDAIADVICPLGFLGLRCLVERHTIQPLTQTEAIRLGKDYALLVGLTTGAKTLSPFNSSLAATSVNVTPQTKQKLSLALNRFFPGKSEFAENWDEWKNKVKKKPSTLLLLPHTEMNAGMPSLEIGKSILWNTLIKNNILPKSIRPRPLVFLIGCETALPEMPYQGFAASFSKAGAAITVITLSPIHESRAVAITEILLSQFYQSSQNNQTFSEALLLARRTAMAKGYPEVLTLVADGDADWILVER